MGSGQQHAFMTVCCKKCIVSWAHPVTVGGGERKEEEDEEGDKRSNLGCVDLVPGVSLLGVLNAEGGWKGR